MLNKIDENNKLPEWLNISKDHSFLTLKFKKETHIPEELMGKICDFLKHYPNIKYFDFSQNKLNIENITFLSKNFKFPFSITSIYFSSTQLTDVYG